MGNIMAIAIRDGFGESVPVEMEILTRLTNTAETQIEEGICIQQNPYCLQITYPSNETENAQLAIYNLSGELLWHKKIQLSSGENLIQVEKESIGKGIVIIELSFKGKQPVQKAVLF